jgi:hypothetical protein
MAIKLPGPRSPPIIPKLHPPNKKLTNPLQPRHKNTKQTSNNKHANALANLQPTALVPHLPKEPQSQIVPDAHDDSEQTAPAQAQTFGQDPEVCGDERERRKEFQEEQRALRKGVEDGDQAVDGVEGEGGDRGDVAGAEEGGLQEEEEEEADAGVGEGEGAVDAGLEGAVAGVGGCCGGGKRVGR